MGTKSWYQSKTIWTAVVTALVGLYNALSAQFHLPPVPEWIFTVLGAVGIYSRTVADTKIG